MRDDFQLPNIKAFQRFDHIPTGPYNLLRSPDLCDIDIPTLAEAVAEFARLCVPAHDTRLGYVGDSYGVVVVGYYCYQGQSPEWMGVQVGFDLLMKQPCLEQLEIVLAEMQARERVEL